MGVSAYKESQHKLRTFIEEVVEEQRFQVRILAICFCDITKEDTLKGSWVRSTLKRTGWSHLDDATASPHAGNASVVQVPLELTSSREYDYDARMLADVRGFTSFAVSLMSMKP
jgi:hypothetical protein